MSDEKSFQYVKIMLPLLRAVVKFSRMLKDYEKAKRPKQRSSVAVVVVRARHFKVRVKMVGYHHDNAQVGMAQMWQNSV